MYPGMQGCILGVSELYLFYQGVACLSWPLTITISYLGIVLGEANCLSHSGCRREVYWVNPSKRGGMDGVFQRLAGLLRGISRGGSPGEIPSNSPASLKKTVIILTLLLQFTFYLKWDI